MSSTNDSYYEKFMGFFGGVSNFPAVKLYIHALNNMAMVTPKTNNLCNTFLCDLNSSTGAPANPRDPIAYDMTVFIHHIYRTLLEPNNIIANKSAMVDAVRYVATLYDGTDYDKQVGARLAEIVKDHVSSIMSDTNNITATPQEWKRANDLTISSPLTKYTFDNRRLSVATSGVVAPPVAPVGPGIPAWVDTLDGLLISMDPDVKKPEYQRVLAKKVALYNLSLYEMKQLGLGHAANSKPANTGSSAAYWTPKAATASSTVGYYRRDGAPGKLYKLVKDASGNSSETEVQVGSKYHTDVMSKPDTCNDVHGTSGKYNYSCTKFVMDCLMGDKKGMNDEKCKAVLKNPAFWNNTKKEVFEDMLPDVACSVLDSFGFQKVRVTNGKYTNLHAFEEKSAWLERLNKNYSSDYDAISKNANLMSYLDMLLNKVNGSPAILNDNFYDKPNGTFNNNRLNGTRLTKYGIPVINTVVNPGSVSLNNITNILGSNMNTNRLAFGLSPILQPIIVMRGGNATISIQQSASQSVPSLDWADQVQRNSPILKKLLEHFTTQLAAVDRQIDSTDKAKLDQAIADLENSEEHLVKNVKVMHEYLNIMLNYSDKYDQTSKNETLENIKKFVESSGKRLDKIDKGTNSLVITLQKLSDALNISVNGKTV